MERETRLLWQAWTLSNALTALILLPIILLGSRAGYARGSDGRCPAPSTRRGLLFAPGLCAVGIVAFGERDIGLSTLAVRLYAPLPFLLWAAVRFGTEGSELSRSWRSLFV